MAGLLAILDQLPSLDSDYVRSWIGQNYDWYQRLDPDIQEALLSVMSEPAPTGKIPAHPWPKPDSGILGPGYDVLPEPVLGRIDNLLYPKGAGPKVYSEDDALKQEAFYKMLQAFPNRPIRPDAYGQVKGLL
jgi:hypothetical protein